jgi:hypothetical protein
MVPEIVYFRNAHNVYIAANMVTAHIWKVIWRALMYPSPFSKGQILSCYLRLWWNAYVTKEKPPNETILGYHVYFHNYPELINLFEEIFIFQVYRFRTNLPAMNVIDGGSKYRAFGNVF